MYGGIKGAKCHCLLHSILRCIFFRNSKKTALECCKNLMQVTSLLFSLSKKTTDLDIFHFQNLIKYICVYVYICAYIKVIQFDKSLLIYKQNHMYGYPLKCCQLPQITNLITVFVNCKQSLQQVWSYLRNTETRQRSKAY